ncbi:MAG: tRNA (adenosine(37)-N6)-threonylcarbamoyltransferase complex dimerization subunit type 1 TsaB [Fluviicoccus sp.]|uniref:tRNA (adenosine(37)-N6)-threonylcarbamoyltransferase complex dimerization subunit type 1 TsaB n=1 Tax=Fluviicoccus sp. TaxID=2003552 RepID=UPI00271F04E8|nr:tRNA (adenosine(37)-N6)-threonylcarbamoyltransferase complex dimerization subunit type 1 TsaB [Fluviicoccus sp.]MDO8331760.1 tRNA (adenosine(37)-N6)-threonylcarbamoyltransferase complex dimerization subunit type 1 TsaB [Fluviicoccus sp.]
MPILALETATEACSAALYLADGRIISRFEHAPRLQTQLLLPMVDDLLREAGITLQNLDAVAYSRGPGAFTGVRIAAAAAQGFAFGLNLPVLALSSLQVLAQHVHRLTGQDRVLALFDARMNEVYAGAYELHDGLMQPVLPDGLYAPQNLPLLPGGAWYLAGNGCNLRDGFPAHLQVKGEMADVHPHAWDLAVLANAAFQRGEAQDAEHALPVYLRDQVWQKLPGR